MNYSKGLLLALLTFSNTSIQAADMADYTICAVYHRILTGQLKQQENMSAVAETERAKMLLMTNLAKLAANEEQGEEFGPEVFLEEWRYHLAEMELRIGKDYGNIYRLKHRYREYCNTLATAAE
jgi:phage pi2 protein 07